MSDDQAMRDEWDKLLAAHRELVWAYLQTLGTDSAPQIGPQVRASAINVGALSKLFGLPLEGESA